MVGTNGLRFPAQIHPNSTASADFREWSSEAIQRAVRAWTETIRMAPLKSPSALFDSGLLGREIPQDGENDSLHPFMALRGWLSNSPPPRAHGAAWVLHLASRADRDSFTRWASARLWLLETRSPEGRPRFEPIRFEWTNPDTVRPLNRR
jgi:hypothetical protein